MPRAKVPPLTPEEQAQIERARERQRTARDEEKKILSAARQRVRDEDRRITALIGVAVRDEAEKNPARKTELIALLTRFFTRENERSVLAAWGVPPLAPPAAPREQAETPSDTPPAEIAAAAGQGFGGGVRLVRH